MDDTEDDARYPPNPHHHRHHSSSSHHHHKLPARSVPAPSPAGHRLRYPRGGEDDEVEEDEGFEGSEEEEAEQNDVDQSVEDAEDDDEGVDDDDDEEEEEEEGGGGRGSGYRRVRAEEPFKRRRKRRRLDRLALGFEFAPRVAASTPSVTPASSRPPPRNSLADWSEDSTYVLLDAWGDLYVQNGRKSLRSDEWMEVAKKVSQSSRTPRSEAQCRNRLDTLKKKYKKEKSKMTESSNSNSKWVYFTKMESLMSSPTPAATRQQPRLPCGFDSGEYVFMNSKVYVNRSNDLDEMRDSPGDSECADDDEDDESDGLPPERAKAKGNSESSSFRMLADSIQKFGEIYEKIEDSKRQHMAELERMRKEFHRDLEIQKRQILERAQSEIAKIRQGAGADEDEDGEDQEDEDINNEDEEIDVSLEDGSS